MRSAVISLSDLAGLEADWRSLVEEYNAYYTEHINDILAERPPYLNELAKMRRRLQRQLWRIANYRITSTTDAAHVLGIALEVADLPNDTPQGRMVHKAVEFLASCAIQGG